MPSYTEQIKTLSPQIVHVSPNSLHNYIAITTDQNGVLLYYVKDIPEVCLHHRSSQNPGLTRFLGLKTRALIDCYISGTKG